MKYRFICASGSISSHLRPGATASHRPSFLRRAARRPPRAAQAAPCWSRGSTVFVLSLLIPSLVTVANLEADQPARQSSRVSARPSQRPAAETSDTTRRAPALARTATATHVHAVQSQNSVPTPRSGADRHPLAASPPGRGYNRAEAALRAARRCRRPGRSPVQPTALSTQGTRHGAITASADNKSKSDGAKSTRQVLRRIPRRRQVDAGTKRAAAIGQGHGSEAQVVPATHDDGSRCPAARAVRAASAQRC